MLFLTKFSKLYILFIFFIYGIYSFNIDYLHNYINNQYINYLYMLLNGILYIYLYLSAYYDYKDKEIYDKYTVPILIIGLLHIYNLQTMAYIALILISIRYIGALILKREILGEADIIIYTGLAGIYNFKDIIGIYILSAFLGIIYAIIQKQKKDKDWKSIPMIPMIVLSLPFINLHLVDYILNLLK